MMLALMVGVGLLSWASAAGRLSCYFDHAAMYRWSVGQYVVEDIPGDLCTHVVYSSVTIDIYAWKIKISDEWSDVRNGGFQRFVGLKSNYPGLKTTVSLVTDWAGYFSQLSVDSVKRKVFIASVVAFLNRWRFDGLDIVWEHPGDTEHGGSAEDKANFVVLLQDLRAAFEEEGRGWEITIQVPVDRARLDAGYNVPALCGLVDAVHLVTYNLRSYTDLFADVHSPLYRRPFDEGNFTELNVNDGVQLWLDRGCPRNKLIVGVPTHGVSFYLGKNSTDFELHTPSETTGGSGIWTGYAGRLAYYEVCEYLARGWTQAWDDVGLVPFAYDEEDKYWVGYENASSVAIKAFWILQKGYGGAMVSYADMDDFHGNYGTPNILIRTLKDVFVREEQGEL